MKLNPNLFKKEDKDSWAILGLKLTETRPPISLTVFCEDGKPTAKMVEKIEEALNDLDALILDAAGHILDNYSSAHFRKLGVPEEKLAQENAEAIAAVISLNSIYIFNPVELEFEMSFKAPWDDHHSFDIEFEEGEAISCAVNG